MQKKIASSRQDRLNSWLDERLGLSGIRYAVPEHANTLPYLLGGISLMGFAILFITGIYLAQFYHPHPTEAHDSVIYIITNLPFGDLIRSVHFWTAQIVTLTVLLHFLRILFTGSYKKPREVNWLFGLGLLAIMLLFVFSGSVLKFDQEGFEALTHNIEAANLLGSLGAWFSTEFSRSVPLLTRVFDGHITILPLLFGLLIAGHIFLIKQHGISPKVEKDTKSQSTEGIGTSRFSAHLSRMLGFGFLLVGGAVLLSLILPAPLGQPGVAGAEVTKPWWMFLWLFPLEEFFGVKALTIAPIVFGIILVLIPIVDRSPWMSPSRRKWVVGIAGTIFLLMIVSGLFAWLRPVAAHLN